MYKEEAVAKALELMTPLPGWNGRPVQQYVSEAQVWALIALSLEARLVD